MNVYTPDDSKIVHYTYSDMSNRQITRPVHLVQYDDALPIIAVKLYNDGQEYTIPSNATVNIRCGKADGKMIYNPALGCDSSRHIVYFEVTKQMTAIAGDMVPVIEIETGNGSACSGAIALSIDYNPVQNDNIRSTNEYLTAKQYAEQAVDAAARAYNSASQADSAKIGRNASTIAVITNKTQEEIREDGEECGNKKLKIILNRNGSQHAEGEYIDLMFKGDNILYEEAKQHEPKLPY